MPMTKEKKEIKGGLGAIIQKEEKFNPREESKEVPNDLLLGDMEDADPTDLLKAAFEVGDRVNALQLLT